MRAALLAIVVTTVLTGCVADVPGPRPAGGETVSGPRTGFEFSFNDTGDLLLRFRIEGGAGRECTIAHQMSGQSVAHGDVYFHVLQNGDGDPLMWDSRDVGMTQVNPSAEVAVGDAVVPTKERTVSDHWRFSFEGTEILPASGLVSTFIGRNLQPWPASPTELDYDRADGGFNANFTLRVAGSCNGPIEVKDIRLGREVVFFNEDDFNGGASARAFLTDDPSDTSLVARGSLSWDLASPFLEVFGMSSGEPWKAGRLALTHPGGEASWVFHPADFGTLIQKGSTAGHHELTLDRASGPLSALTGVIAEVSPVESMPSS